MVRTQKQREPQSAKEEHAEEVGTAKNTREAKGPAWETSMVPAAASWPGRLHAATRGSGLQKGPRQGQTLGGTP